MRYVKLGTTGLDVSKVCLGTMTWGEQNTEAEAHAQLDYAVAQGVNFIDTAELYPIAPKAETYSLTEQYIGRWLKARGDRDKLVIASKSASCVFPGRPLPWIRGGKANYGKASIAAAVDASLQRLQTDYIDLYQLHWPERSSNYFGLMDYPCPVDEHAWTPLLEVLEALQEQMKAGKIRHIGVSNETPWGVMKYLQLAEKYNLPRIASVQNPYHLLNRMLEVGLSEVLLRENIALLGYSPLGFGALTGKYSHGALPVGARMSLFPDRYARFLKPETLEIIDGYVAIARKYGLDPATMAIAFACSRPFMTTPILGATSVEQLAVDIAAAEVVLPEACLNEINALHLKHPNPCC